MDTISRDDLKAKMDRGEKFALVEALGKVAYDHAHLPGAINLPASGNLDADGLFFSDGLLQRRFLHHQGEGRLGVSCGSGVSAAHLAVALAISGVTPALYVGSWSAWSADPDKPVAYGDVQAA